MEVVNHKNNSHEIALSMISLIKLKIDEGGNVLLQEVAGDQADLDHALVIAEGVEVTQPNKTKDCHHIMKMSTRTLNTLLITMGVGVIMGIPVGAHMLTTMKEELII